MRVFVGIEFSDEVKAQIAKVQQRLIALAPRTVRWTMRDNFHLTLVFIGEIETARSAQILPVIADVAKAYTPLWLSLSGFGVFPKWHLPRVLWLGVHEPSGQLRTLQRDLAAAMQAFGVKEDARPYHPHLTLGYVRPDGDAAQHTARALRHEHLSEIAHTQANALTFFESRKDGPTGETRYCRLAHYGLSASE